MMTAMTQVPVPMTTIHGCKDKHILIIHQILQAVFDKSKFSKGVQTGGTRGQGDRKFFRLVQTDERGRIELIYIIYIL